MTGKEGSSPESIVREIKRQTAGLTERIREWVEYYNHRRYHEAIDNLTPADKYYGRDRMILKKREKLRTDTMMTRRELNQMAMLEPLPNGVSYIVMRDGIRSLRNQHASPKPPDDKQTLIN